MTGSWLKFPEMRFGTATAECSYVEIPLGMVVVNYYRGGWEDVPVLVAQTWTRMKIVVDVVHAQRQWWPACLTQKPALKRA